MLAHQVLQEGEGIPLVFFHGFLGTFRDWFPLLPYLPLQSCIGIDLPGHGQSDFITEWTIPFERFHLIGYSLGGRVALSYSQKHPEQIASLTLLSTHPGLKDTKEKLLRWQSDLKWAELLENRSLEEFLHLWYQQPVFAGFKPDLRERKNQDPMKLKKALLHYSLAKQERSELKGVLIGEKDERFRSLYQDFVLIEKAGHMIHLENPKAVAFQILQNISSPNFGWRESSSG